MHSLLNIERRTGRRYDLRLPVQYRISPKGDTPRSGSGLTCDISTAGLSFRSRRPLPVGSHIELTVAWPTNSDILPVDLQITGFVVRSDSGHTAVRLTSHRFRAAEAAVAAPIRASA